MNIAVRFGLPTALGLVATCAGTPSFAAFVINQVTGANYRPVSTAVDCGMGLGAGMCLTSLEPPRVISLGPGNPTSTRLLRADLAAQKPGFTVGGYGGSLNLNFNLTSYAAFNDGTVGGGQLTAAFTPQPGQILPANLHWVQIVTTNYNGNGVNGANLSAPRGLGNQQNSIDAAGVTSPYYDVALGARFPTNKALVTPPRFRDRSRRPEPTAAVPTVVWNAELFLVSGASMMTVYNEVEWGWATQFSTDGMFAPLPAVPVPEPAAWTTMLLGCGMLASLARRRRRLEGA